MSRKPVLRAALLTALAGTAILLCVQVASSAWQRGWGTNSDSPAHLVSALLVREYILEGIGQGRPPMEFAREFYHRFPKVAIGHWGPIQPAALGLWMTVTPLTPAWILGFQALLAGVVAGFTVLLGSSTLSVRNSVLAGLVLAVSPAVVGSSRIVMADLMTAAWVTAGLVAYVSYWKRPGWRSSTLFGFCAAGALLTKPGGIILAFPPPLCVLSERRWRLLKEPSFWWPILLVAMIYGPWYVTFSEEMLDGWRASSRWYRRLVQLPGYNLYWFASVLGLAGTLAAAWGAWRMRPSATRTVLLCTIGGAFAFHALLAPTAGARHFITVAPILAILAAAGVARAGGWAWLILIAVAGFVTWSDARSGVSRLVEVLLDRGNTGQTWLVTGRAAIEGDVVAQAALRRSSGGLTVYRGSKLFVRSRWGGWTTQLIVGTPDEAERLIEQCRIDAVITGKGTPLVVAEAVGRDPSRWKRLENVLDPAQGVVFVRLGEPRAGLPPPIIQEP